MKLRPTCTLKSLLIRHNDYIKNLSPNNWAKISAHVLLERLKLHRIAEGISLFLMSLTLKNMLLLSSKKTWNNKIQCNMPSIEVIRKFQLRLRLFYVITTNIQPGKVDWIFSPGWKNPNYSSRKLQLWKLYKPIQKYKLWVNKNKKQKKQANIFFKISFK